MEIQRRQARAVAVEPEVVEDHGAKQNAVTLTNELPAQALSQRQIHIIPVVLMQIMIMLAARLYFRVIPLLNRDHAENWGFIFATTCYTA